MTSDCFFCKNWGGKIHGTHLWGGVFVGSLQVRCPWEFSSELELPEVWTARTSLLDWNVTDANKMFIPTATWRDICNISEIEGESRICFWICVIWYHVIFKYLIPIYWILLMHVCMYIYICVWFIFDDSGFEKRHCCLKEKDSTNPSFNMEWFWVRYVSDLLGCIE